MRFRVSPCAKARKFGADTCCVRCAYSLDVESLVNDTSVAVLDEDSESELDSESDLYGRYAIPLLSKNSVSLGQDAAHTGKCQFKSPYGADLNCAYLPTVVL